MKDASAPDVAPAPAPLRPESARPEPGGPPLGRWLAGIALIAAIAVFVYLKTRPSPAVAQKAAAVQTRTATVALGTVERSIRLTGVTAAQNFASLIAPQLHGGRHGPTANVNQNVSMPAGSVKQISSNLGASSSSPPSGGSAPATGGGQLQNTISRFSAPRSGGSSKPPATATASGGPNAMGPTGTGSTGASAGASMGGDSGGGGMNFSLTLQYLVPPGSRVKKGQTIAEFDRQYMLQLLDDYLANQAQVDQALRALETNIEVDRQAHKQLIAVAKATVDKTKLDLKTVPVQSANTAEKLKLNAEEAEAQYKQALAEVASREASRQAQLRIAQLERDESKLELRRSQMNADRMVIKAPMDGITVMSTIFRAGELGQIQQGDQLYPGMLFMRVVDTNSMVVNATVNQTDVELLRLGAKARVRFDAYPDLELPAHVFSVGAMAKTGNVRGSFVKEIPVVLKLDGIDPRVIPDLSVSVDVVLDRQEQATMAPRESIFYGEGGKPFVFVRTPEGWIRREVELGLMSNTHVAVQSGVSRGEVLAAEWPVQKQGS